jgi:hypothetical protein
MNDLLKHNQNLALIFAVLSLILSIMPNTVPRLNDNANNVTAKMLVGNIFCKMNHALTKRNELIFVQIFPKYGA